MSEFKGTPGPWKVGKPFKTNGNVYVDIDWAKPPCGECKKGGGDSLVARTFKYALPYEHQKHNARLIAAAPDLLDACRVALNELYELIDCRDRPEDHPDASVIEIVRAAIAKAEGRMNP